MRRMLWDFLFLCLSSSLWAQDAQTLLDFYQRSFTDATIDVKIKILQDAAANKDASSFGPLYTQAVDYLVDNGTLLPTNQKLRQLAFVAADQSAKTAYVPARRSLLKLFLADSEPQVRIRLADALGIVAVGDSEVISGINRFLYTENSNFAAGNRSDPQVMSAVVRALGKLRDPSSFPALFTAMNIGYSTAISSEARDALLSVKGDLKDCFIGVIESAPILEKRKALEMALQTDSLSNDQKGRVAERALAVALHEAASDQAGKNALRQMRMASAIALGERNQSSATPLLSENLDMTILEFDRGLTDKRSLLEAVSALGSMESHDAAVRLTQFLALINSYTERGKAYDEQVVLTVVGSLGTLSDRVASDDLKYALYLKYPASVLKLAQESLDKLK